MPRFFVEYEVPETADRITMGADDTHHILHVLRMKAGRELDVVDEHHVLHRCRIPHQVGSDGPLEVEILSRSAAGGEMPFRVTLYQGVPKSDKFALIVRQCVELGVSRIVPVICRRSVARPELGKSRSKGDRWRKVAEAAAKQCGRSGIPVIDDPVSFQTALDELAEAHRRGNTVFIPYEGEMTAGLKAMLDGLEERPRELAFFIGPEGGFAAEETAAFESAGLSFVTLGPRILRTETAGAAVMAMLVYEYETGGVLPTAE